VVKEEHIPSRRTGKTSPGAKVFSYYTQEERRLLEKAQSWNAAASAVL